MPWKKGHIARWYGGGREQAYGRVGAERRKKGRDERGMCV